LIFLENLYSILNGYWEVIPDSFPGSVARNVVLPQ